MLNTKPKESEQHAGVLGVGGKGRQGSVWGWGRRNCIIMHFWESKLNCIFVTVI